MFAHVEWNIADHQVVRVWVVSMFVEFVLALWKKLLGLLHPVGAIVNNRVDEDKDKLVWVVSRVVLL